MPDKISPLPVKIPLINPNEPEAVLSAVHVKEGQQVAEGETLCTLETTKSAAELEAEVAGYVVDLQAVQGQTVRAGELLCYLAESPDWIPARTESLAVQTGEPERIPPGLRITQPAIALARQNSLDLARLPIGPLITEKTVRALMKALDKGPDLSPPPSAFDPTAILLYGGGGHGKMLIDLLRASGNYQIAGIIDDGMSAGSSVLGVPVLGGGDLLPDLYTRGVHMAANAVGGIGNVAVRIQVFRRLAEAGFVFPVAIHPRALVEPGARLTPGVQVLAHAYVGSEAVIGFGSIINTGSIVSHDCRLGNYVNISPGAILAGDVEIGSGALVGMGATVNLGVKIGEQARIGNGATVKADVPDGGIVRAGMIWPD